MKKNSFEINNKLIKEKNSWENILIENGDKHKYQYILIILMCLINSICANYYFSIPYFFEEPTYYICLNKSCSNKKISTLKESCNSKYGKELKYEFNNFIKSLDLTCERQKYIKILNSLIFFFSSFISIISINLSDIIGRKKMILGGLIWLLVLFVLNIFLFDTYILILIINFIIWGILDSFLAIILIFISESTGKIIREKGWNSTAFVAAISGIIINIIIFKNWKYFILIEIIIIIIAFILIYYLTTETIFFLKKKKLFNKLNQSLKFISKVNKKIFQRYEYKQIEDEDKEDKKKLKFIEKIKLLINKKNLFNLIALSMVNINNFFCYQIIWFSTSNLNNNIRLNGILSCSSEFLSFLIMTQVTYRFKRLKIFKISTILILLFCITFIFVKNKYYNMIIGFVFIKFFVCVNMSVSFIYQNELFETKIRSLGTSISIFLGRFLGSLSPLVDFLNPISDNPIIVCVLTNIICIPFLFFMKETFNKGILD